MIGNKKSNSHDSKLDSFVARLLDVINLQIKGQVDEHPEKDIIEILTDIYWTP